MAFCQVIARIDAKDPIAFTALCANDTIAQEKLLDRWLQCISSHSIEEMFSTAASLAGLLQRKTLSIAILILIDTGNAVLCENATQVLPLVRSVVHQSVRMRERVERFREMQKKSQLDRQLERIESEVLLNDPVDSFDILPLFERVIGRFPIDTTPIGSAIRMF